MNTAIGSLDIATLTSGYIRRLFTPWDVIEKVLERIEQADDPAIWISRLPWSQLQVWLDELQDSSPAERPLFGIPFAIKDNIDLQGVPTTAACPDYAYTPAHSAFVVRRLIEAGAIPVGKTNLDQFATGLVGTRSPWGACRNSFDPRYLSGGSSSGSAVSVASGLASFSLGTDTAGSGRVPAAFNNLVGIKPTRGLISTRGVVPACRSLDCVSVFALTMADASRVAQVCSAFDEGDDFARPQPVDIPVFSPTGFRFGVPAADQLEFFGNREARTLFDRSVQCLQRLGGEAVSIDFEPFLKAARLLYEGPWVSERYAAIAPFIDSQPDALLPVTRGIIAAGRQISAVQAFEAQYSLQACRRATEACWEQVDLVVTPTAGTIFTLEEVEREPVRRNSDLGYYTNFMNLLDLAAVALPAGFQEDGLPFGITLFAPAFADDALAALGERWQQDGGLTLGATGLPLPSQDDCQSRALEGCVKLAVCGAHMSGLPLNHQLVERGAWLVEATRTAAGYRLYALPGGPPMRPALVRDAGGAGIEVEVWAMPRARVGSFLQLIPAPLGLGKVELENGQQVTGFICEPAGIQGAEDITALGGWRAWLARSG